MTSRYQLRFKYGLDEYRDSLETVDDQIKRYSASVIAVYDRSTGGNILESRRIFLKLRGD
jgi:hypothetical protein